MTISATIADVITATEVFITAGREQGVERGDLAIIYDRWEIEDPATGEVLGNYSRPRVRFRVKDVQDRFSLCETFEYMTRRTPGGGLLQTTDRAKQRISVRGHQAEDWRTVFVDLGEEVSVEKPPED